MHALSAFVTAILISTMAEAAPDQYPVAGVGVVYCENLHGQKDHAAAIPWVQGFVAGLNMASEGDNGHFRSLTSLSLEDEEAILQRYCEDHPKAFYFQAAEHLYEILPDAKASDTTKDSQPLAITPK